jgi:glycosyltransferase involved in cell wall biosynthesis
MSLTILYCGADRPWHELQKTGFTRRNTCLLRALSYCGQVEHVIAVNYVLRSELAAAIVDQLRRRDRKANRVIDIFVTSILPERWSWLRILNRWMTRLQIWLQAGSLPHKNLIAWCYWPEGYRIARRLQFPGSLVFDADHDILHDENQSAGSHAELENLLKECAQRADLVVAGACSILGWFREHGARYVFRLRNGVDLARFPAHRKMRRPEGGPVIGYVGTLSPWVDHELLFELAQKRPGWCFRVVGATYKQPQLKQLAELPNVQLIGKRSAEELRVELEQFDVALGLYRMEEWLDVDSMKLFDYLAAGVPVVSTPFHPYLRDDFGGLVQLAQNAEAICSAIECILAWEETNRSSWEERRKVFIAQNTWSVRATEAVNELLRLARTE